MMEGEMMFEQGLQGFEKILGSEHKWTLHTLCCLGRLYKNQDKLVEAEIMYQRALEGYEKLLGPNDTLTMGTAKGLREVEERKRRMC
jgi:Tetratricopeptide repeat